MSFTLGPGYIKKQNEFQSFARGELCSGDHFPWDNLGKAARRGYMGLPLPAEWGGQGEDFLSYILLIEQISTVCASTGVIIAVHTSVGSYPLYLFGTKEQKERYLVRLARGDILGAFALTEPCAGSDPAAMRATASKVKGGYRLNGTKIFITGGNEADLYTVFTSGEASSRKMGISAFLVEKGSPGLEFSPPEKKMGLKGSSTASLYLNDLFVPEENRLGAEGEGFKIAMALLDGGRIGIAAQGLGIARACIMDTVEVMKIDPLAQSALKESRSSVIADLWTRLEAASLLTYRAAALKDMGVPVTMQASMAKLFATDLAVEASTRCLDLVGLEGGRENNPLSRYFCDAKVTQIYEGTNQIQRIVVSRELLRKY